MDELLIRRAGKNDLPSWSEMRSFLWPSDTRSDHLAELTGLLEQDSVQGWVALSGPKYIGFAEASIRPYANGCDSRPVVFLEGVWVDESYRNCGVGRNLLNAVEDWAQEKGIAEIGSDAEFSNAQSHACHKKWGFEEVERVIYFRKRVDIF
jgi:aminoglycoside 6'-N-acetyltransferase I